MKRTLSFALAFLLVLTVVGFAADFKVARLGPGPPDVPSFVGYAPDKIVVNLAADIRARINWESAAHGLSGLPELDHVGARHGVAAIAPQFPGARKKIYRGRVVDLAGWHEVRFHQDTDVLAAVAAYKALPGVLDAQPVGVHGVSAIPSDQYYSPDAGPYYFGWHLEQIQMPLLWNFPDKTGNPGVIVAIPDTGVRYYHQDLAGPLASPDSITPTTIAGNVWLNSRETSNLSDNVDEDGNGYKNDWRGWDFVASATNPLFYSCTPGEDCSTADNDPRDFNGHGTHCAGIVAALTNNLDGVASVAGGWEPTNPGVKIMPLRVGWSASDWFFGEEVGLVEMAYAAQSLRYAADNGARIVSCSWGSSNTGGLGDAINYFLADGGLVFKAAGNDSSETADYMCSREDVISVAATSSPLSLQEPDSLAYFSNYGTWVDICAPGEAILSLWHYHEDPANDYATIMDGTSMACPLAAGVAALIWSRDLNLTAAQVKTHLFNTADNIDSANPGLAGKLGHGRVNAFRAVTEELPPTPTIKKIGVTNLEPGNPTYRQGQVVQIKALVVTAENPPVPLSGATVTIRLTGPSTKTLTTGLSGTDGWALATWATNRRVKTGYYTATVTNVTHPDSNYEWNSYLHSEANLFSIVK